MTHIRMLAAVAAAALAIACGGTEAADDPDESAAAAPPGGGATSTVAPNADSSRAADTARSGAPSGGASAAATPAPRADADTVVGTVQLMGPAADERLVIQTADGAIAVAGRHETALRGLEGMDLWVQGPIATLPGRAIPPRQITAEQFEIRTVAGVPVLDGMLREADGGLEVVDRRGLRTRLTTFPEGLRDLVGRRVWITRAADGGVASFGEVRA